MKTGSGLYVFFEKFEFLCNDILSFKMTYKL